MTASSSKISKKRVKSIRPDKRETLADRSLCGACEVNDRSPGQSYCAACRAKYMRRWRAAHPLTPEQRFKDNARSYAGVYKRRGKLIQQPCGSCGSPESQMHHPDYSEPLLVEWLCRPCHLAHHREELAIAA